MYPNQQYSQGGGAGGAPYPQQPSYGAGQGYPGGYQQNMSTPYGGTQGGFGGAGNSYNQGGYPYAQSGGYGPTSGQQPYGANSYGQNYDAQRIGHPVPQGGGYMPNDQRMQRFNQVAQQYQINQQFAARLLALGDYEVVVLCDDSGSMNTAIQGTNQTRWDELKSVVSIVADVAALTDSNGVDVYFLNRDPMLNVTDTRYIRQVFNTPPQGLTPLVPALRRILAAKRNQTYGKKLLILIATDGAPTNERGQLDIATLEAVLRHERTPETYVTFLACTDDLQAVSYLSNWDRMIPKVDVMDDYRAERAEVQRTRGGNFPFSFGDYIVKSLLGSIDSWFDSLDDRA